MIAITTRSLTVGEACIAFGGADESSDVGFELVRSSGGQYVLARYFARFNFIDSPEPGKTVGDARHQ